MSQAVTTREAISPDVTDAQIQRLIQERRSVGAQDVTIVTEGNQRFIVVTWPRLTS